MTAIPKPRKEDRVRANFDTSDLALSKSHFLRDGEYKAWIRTHRCVLVGFTDVKCRAIGERQPVEAAHLQSGGRGVKGSDASCIPLCPVHHDALDGQTVPWQMIAFCWMKAWELREEWFRRISK